MASGLTYDLTLPLGSVQGRLGSPRGGVMKHPIPSQPSLSTRVPPWGEHEPEHMP